MRYVYLIMIALGVVLLLFGIFAMLYPGRAYWGMHGPVDYEYPYARYTFPLCVVGIFLLILTTLLIVRMGWRQNNSRRTRF